MNEEPDFTDWRNWSRAYCPDCGQRAFCYYSMIDGELTLTCKEYGGQFRIKKEEKE